MGNLTAKKIEETEPIIQPIQPNTAIDQAGMIKIMTDKINEIIVVLNILMEEAKWKKV